MAAPRQTVSSAGVDFVEVSGKLDSKASHHAVVAAPRQTVSNAAVDYVEVSEKLDSKASRHAVVAELRQMASNAAIDLLWNLNPGRLGCLRL